MKLNIKKFILIWWINYFHKHQKVKNKTNFVQFWLSIIILLFQNIIDFRKLFNFYNFRIWNTSIISHISIYHRQLVLHQIRWDLIEENIILVKNPQQKTKIEIQSDLELPSKREVSKACCVVYSHDCESWYFHLGFEWTLFHQFVFLIDFELFDSVSLVNIIIDYQ
jgi:hypothetical protein